MHTSNGVYTKNNKKQMKVMIINIQIHSLIFIHAIVYSLKFNPLKNVMTGLMDLIVSTTAAVTV